ncbi:hypothetical protein HMPREF1635_02935 [Clostridiales bacterium S5-A14a]|nr:hypothetical protein HMPREF1635_02935 [Clostridiales bacterium S5-A14a]
MDKRQILYNISDESLEQMIPCFNPVVRNYMADEIILSYTYDKPGKVAVMRNGSAKLEILNSDGETFLLEHYFAGDIFGEFFSLPISNYEYLVTAIDDCEVVYIDYNHIIKPCENLCNHHSQLISNLFIMSAQRTQELSLHISILGQSSTRSKLTAYFKYISGVNSNSSDGYFEIPMKLTDLAKYLHVDRSAMMREIRRMISDGLIEGGNGRYRML